MNFFKIMRIAGILSEWMETALTDGVIDKQEIIALISNIMDIMGVKVQIKVE